MQLENMVVSKYMAIPIISRIFFTVGLGLTIMTYLDLVSPYNLIYSWPHIKKLELWRAVSTFVYWGPATLDVLIHQIFMLKYSIMLEESCGDPAEFLYMLLVGMGLILGMGNFLGLSKMSGSLSTYMIYIWCKKNPLIMVHYMNVLTIPAYYTPCLMLLFSFLLEKKIPQNDIIGIIAGHTYFYFKTVHTKTSGKDILQTPGALKRLFSAASFSGASQRSSVARASEGVSSSTVTSASRRVTTLDDVADNE